MRTDLDFKRIPGWLFPEDAYWMVYLSRRHGIDRALEIGTWCGKSAVALYTAGYGEIVCVDDYKIDSQASVDAIRLSDMSADQAKLIFKGICEKSNGVIKLVEKSSENYIDVSIYDLVHIDADHEEISAHRDIEKFWKNVSPGGIMVIDDWINGKWGSGIRRAACEIIGTQPNLSPTLNKAAFEKPKLE